MLKRIYKEAFNLAWKNPFLWLFGFLAAFLANNEIIVLFLNSSKILQIGGLPINLSYLRGNYLLIFKSLQKFIFLTPTNLLIFLFVIFISLFVFYLSSLSQGILIKNTATKNKLLKNSLKGADKYSLKIFFLNLLVLVFDSFLIYLFIFKFNLNANPALAFTLVFFILLIILVLSFIARYSICFICLEEKPLFSSLKEATKFFFKNWLISVVNSFIIFLFNILLGLLLFLIGLNSYYSFSITAQFLGYFNLTKTIWFLMFFNLTLIIFVFVFFLSIFSAWQYSAWGLLYQSIKSGKKEEKKSNI